MARTGRPLYCAPCESPPAREFMKRRIREGAMLSRIAQEMKYLPRVKEWGIEKPPTEAVLDFHVRKHEVSLAPMSTPLDTFDIPGDDEAPRFTQSKATDVATALQEAALEMLAEGRME